MKDQVQYYYGGGWANTACQNWYAQDSQSTTWSSYLQPCPCTLNQTYVDFGRFQPTPDCNLNNYNQPGSCPRNQGAVACYQSTNVTWVYLGYTKHFTICRVLGARDHQCHSVHHLNRCLQFVNVELILAVVFSVLLPLKTGTNSRYLMRVQLFLIAWKPSYSTLLLMTSTIIHLDHRAERFCCLTVYGAI